MKKRLFKYMVILSSLLVLVTACSTKKEQDSKLTVAVSILPCEGIVKSIAGDLVNIVTLIPAGASPANYQPTPKIIEDFNKSNIYFTIGVPTEEANILPNISKKSDIKIVKLEEKVSSKYEYRYFDKEKTKPDPHIWMSPKRMIVMIEVIRDELIKIDKSNKKIYNNNANDLIERIELVNAEIMNNTSKMNNKSFIIMHPSMGYFADDYGLEQVAIEKHGKKATANHLKEVINFAKEKQIKIIFYQKEFDYKQVETIANEINGKVEEINILSTKYVENLEKINQTLKELKD